MQTSAAERSRHAAAAGPEEVSMSPAVKGLWLVGLVLCGVVCSPVRTSHGDSRTHVDTSRFGVGVSPSYGRIGDYAIEQLHIGWYSDWSINIAPQRPCGVEYAQLIRVSADSYPPNWETIARIIAANPASLWIIGNEPECISQDNRTPQEYAGIYHQCHAFIKSHDPDAQLAIGGVVVPTPLRLQWLADVLEAYQSFYSEPMPIDVWNIHVQILQEKRGSWGCGIPAGLSPDEGELFTVEDNADPDLFNQLVWAFRRWLADRGHRDKPLIISEFGVLMPSEYLGNGDRATGDKIVTDFMSSVFDFLRLSRDESVGCPGDDQHLVQRWVWYSLNEPYYDFQTQTGMNGGLFEAADPPQLTVLGHHWKRYMDALLGTQHQVYLPLHFPALAVPSTMPGENPSATGAASSSAEAH